MGYHNAVISRRQLLQTAGAVAASAITVGQVPTTASAADDGEFTKTDPITIESFDGTDIEASLFVPDADGPHPAILMTHGWGGTRSDRDPLATRYAANDYVVLTYDSRGFGNSGGAVTVDGPDEVGDAKRLITWLANRDEVQTDGPDNPRIGMDGYSYGAGIQLNTAAEDDRLDALVPRWGWWNLSFSNAPNDVLKWAWFYGLVLSGRANGTLDEEFNELSQQAIDQQDAPDALEELWVSRSPVEDLDQVDTPTLLISGWEDRLFPANEPLNNYHGLTDADTDTRLLLYDFGHDFAGSGPTPTQIGVANESALAWLDKHLKDADETVPDVQLYSSQEDAFRSYDALPATDHTVDIGSVANGGATQLSTAGQDQTTATFEFSFEESVELAGVPTLSAHVTPTGQRTHLFAALSDVGPDGTTTLLKDQVAATEVTEPGRVTLDLYGIQRELAADHTLRLTLTLNDDALIEDSVPFGDGLYIDSETPAGAVIAHSRGKPAELTLPVVSGP